MIIQHSAEWYDARAGKFTASRMAELMAHDKRNGKPLKSVQTYIDDVIAERLTGTAKIIPASPAMRRGYELEPEAREMYAFERDVTVEEAGFYSVGEHDCLGASPDGLIGDDGLLEIKCPESITKHVTYLRDHAHKEEYHWQVQTQLAVTDRKWCDLVSYHPSFPPELQLAIVRVERDEAAIKALWEAAHDAILVVYDTIAEIEKLKVA